MYFSREERNRSSAEIPVVVGDCAALIVAEDAAEPTDDDEVQVMRHPSHQGARLPNSEMIEVLSSRLDHLSIEQQGDVTYINRFHSLFNDVPTQTNVLQHHIDTTLTTLGRLSSIELTQLSVG